ncbi:MAG TPA: SGNH/GDSL hydrolase family protein [Flavitalea sp.]|nr:SGNH/GDSL hydrolase family protein [Flavitalea sp.]
MNKAKGTRHKKIKIAGYIIYLLLFVWVGLEIAFRIYNPFHFRIRGDKILLPVNQKILISNKINPRLDSEITNTRNALGFRGPEMPPNAQDYLSIITVGGSTTECRFLNDDHTWPFLTGEQLKKKFRNIWLNNAGLDGHSSFGHQAMLYDYLAQLKPKVIVFLMGINDVESDQPSFHDKLNTRGAYPDLKHYLYNHLETVNLAVNLARGWRAQRFNNTTQALKLPEKGAELFLTEAQMQHRLSGQETFLDQYGKRIEQLIDTCRYRHIQPVFITQPSLYGSGTDSLTGANLARSKIDEGMNGELFWRLLELYNERLKETCERAGAPVIDLAAKMPKNSLYYYDASHFTNEGAEQVAGIVSEELSKALQEKFPEYILQ